MSQFSRHEHLVRLLQDLAVRRDIAAADKPAAERVDVRRAVLSALGLVALGPLLVSAIRDLRVPLVRVAGADLGGFALATIASLYSFQVSPTDPWDPLFVSGGKVVGAFAAGDATVLVTDEVATGERALTALAVLRGAGLRPTGVVAVLDRETGGSARVLDECPFASLLTLKELLA